MKTIGVVLAGGRSTRFGEQKSLYEFNGRKMYQHVYDALSESGVCDDIVISTNETLEPYFDYKTVIDDEDYQDYGPLGGLYAAAKAHRGDRLLVVSCDTPFITAEWLKKLYDSALANPNTFIVSAEDDKMHPTISVFQGIDLIDELEGQLKSKRLSFKAFFNSRNVKMIDVCDTEESPGIFRNINYKSDMN
ncbi:MAG TPA: molybdenum cofactor guanylyltransferase [Candidatus Salinicoccus merdavium]|nr:molybdenum cofactor guanylyltransferase [Candidatus Salinicoccus merdavium]